MDLGLGVEDVPGPNFQCILGRRLSQHCHILGPRDVGGCPGVSEGPRGMVGVGWCWGGPLEAAVSPA